MHRDARVCSAILRPTHCFILEGRLMSTRWVYVGLPSGRTGTGGAAQVLAVHAALLPTGAHGMILYFAGNQWVEPKVWEQVIDTHPDDPAAQPGYAAAKAEIDHTRLFDCATKAITNPGSPDADLFCCGHSLLADGRLITAGGTQHWPI